MRRSSLPSVGQATVVGIGDGRPRQSPSRRRHSGAAAALLLAASAVGGTGSAGAGPIRHGGYANAGELDNLHEPRFEQISLQPWRSLEISFAGLLHGAQAYGQRITHRPDQPARFALSEPPSGS